MPFEFFELEDNFVADYATDPYRRKHIRVRYSLGIGESMERAENMVHEYIKEYIYKNTINNPHIQLSNVDVPLPIIQYEPHADKYPTYTEQTLEEQIRSCTDIKVLESYKFIAAKDLDLHLAYQETMVRLISQK